MDYNPEKIQLKPVVDEITEIFILASQKKQIEVKCTIQDETFIFADENMLKTILRNLVNNAIKFTHTNGIVEIYTETRDSQLDIYVKDNGIGISEEKLKEIFSTSTISGSYGTDNEKGSGLGLMISKEFIEKHGGILEIESELKSGSTFKISLPTHY